MNSKPHRLSSCHRHPTKSITGFCASCLRERLADIDSSSGHEYPADEVLPTAELRRSKSCSRRGVAATAAATSASVLEPRRRSCEVRARNTLSDLFDIDDKKKGLNRKVGVECESVGFGIREEGNGNDKEGVRVCEDSLVSNGGIADGCDGIEEETKTVKEFIDLELQSRKNAGRDFREIAGSFWQAASQFSEKLRKWRRKQKLNKHSGGSNGSVALMGLEVDKSRLQGLRETQSEIGDFGLGRRSCDTNPRLSIDAGRMSVDDPRFSFDGPRASWDGYLMGKAYPRLSPMISVVEDVNGPINGNENRLLVEEKMNLDCAGVSPGGSAQTKDYYSDSLSWQRRRRSFDRSNSHRRLAIAEVDELKVISNAKVSPATTELFYGAKVLITEKDLRDMNSNPPKKVQSDCVLASASHEASGVPTEVNQKGSRKFHRWSRVWNNMGIVQRRREDKFIEEYAAGDVANKPLAESWQKLRRAVNGQSSDPVSQKLIRSYSASCRNPCRTAGLTNGMGGPDTKCDVLNGRQEFMLQRNRSTRHSPNYFDTGLLRFYLTPSKSYRRSKSGKSTIKDLHPTARGVL